MNILVTGGAGYIGSITAQKLCDQGHQVSVVDDLSKGHRQFVPSAAKFHHGKVHDIATVSEIIKQEKIDDIKFIISTGFIFSVLRFAKPMPIHLAL